MAGQRAYQRQPRTDLEPLWRDGGGAGPERGMPGDDHAVLCLVRAAEEAPDEAAHAAAGEVREGGEGGGKGERRHARAISSEGRGAGGRLRGRGRGREYRIIEETREGEEEERREE